MLWRDDGLNHRREVVNIGQGLDAEDDVVERRAGGAGCFFWCSDDCVIQVSKMCRFRGLC